MTGLRRAAALLAAGVGAVILAASLLTGSPDSHLALRLSGTAGAAAAVIVLLRRPVAGQRASDLFEDLWWRGAGQAHPDDPPERQELHRLVRLAVGSADIAHERLRPVLRDLADAWFEAAFGTHPDHDPRAAERLGPVAWAWLRPDRREPVDRHAPGPGPAELAEVVTAIERLHPDGDQDPR